MALNQIRWERMEPAVSVSYASSGLSGWHEALKRLFDVCTAVLAICVLMPLLVVVALAIKRDSPGPVIYRQTRVGRGGRLFQIYKFRSMRQDADVLLPKLMQYNEAPAPLFKMRRDPRVTRLGGFLRRTSIDELPQLLNVIEGSMSLVGPRPPLPSEVERYEAWQLRRLEATPGITGLWQVSGRSNLAFSEMVSLDLFYVDNRSLGLDVMVLLRTIPTVLRGRGAH
ncbi:MAG: exopolysaccharide biosynthesis polyprenyl glycosylphosphotransferase [Chloroflexi bacterium]|nr:exopolysaccharide biosynthesis polyprenyl glycosylphosphotransferase [Chloroflexota bacterium]